MSDARWGEPREYGERDRDEGRPRVYDERDRDDHDPRDGLMHDLDLPRGEERELVLDRDRVYELNGEDSRTLAAVGAFRVVPEHELDINDDTLDHLRDEGLVATVDLGDDDRGVVLTKDGRDLLDSDTLDREDKAPQAFYAGVSRPREIDHDANLYATYRQEEARLRDEHGGLDIRRVILEQDPKREYQEFLQEHNRNRSDSDGRPDRDEDELRDWAHEHDLPLMSLGDVAGFTQRQREFLTTVMVHSGCFLERQYCAFTGTARGQNSREFVARLVARGFARAIKPGAVRRGRLYHVHHKPLYEAIGHPDTRRPSTSRPTAGNATSCARN